MIQSLYGYIFNTGVDIRRITAAEFFFRIAESAFILIFNIYLSKLGYSDVQIANYTAYRYLAGLVLAIPLGMYIKGRRLKPYLLFASIVLPIASVITIYSAKHTNDTLLFWSLIAWGTAFTIFEICSLPYIIRNTPSDEHTNAITLHFAAAPTSTLVAGFIIYLLKFPKPHLHDEWVLYILSCLSLFSVYFILRIGKDKGSRSLPYGHFEDFRQYEWGLVAKAIVPALIVAIGAGLTIPYFNLFFFHTFHISSGTFSILGGITAIVVSMAALMTPYIKNRLGYTTAITGTQSISVICLILLGCTQYFHQYAFGFYAAALFFMLRQPLMNMAYPLTSEISMNYVGERNHELLSAIISAIWSGCWWVSAQILKQLLIWDLDYSHIFFITAGMYIIGIYLYNLILKEYQRKQKQTA